MTAWYVFETLTGRILHEFTPVSGRWTARLNEPETLDVSVSLEDQTRDGIVWRELAAPWKHSLLMEVDGRLLGGPIQPHSLKPGQPLGLTARGLRSLFARRTVLPPAAATTPLVRADGTAEPALDTVLGGLDLGSIGRALVAQACAWPGFGLPLDLEPSRAGSESRRYIGAELTTVEAALTDLSAAEAGPDFEFRLEWAGDSAVRWRMLSGSAERPELASPDVFTWDLAAADTSGDDLAVSVNPARLGSLSWVTGRGAGSSLLAARAFDPTLVDAGTPLLELVGSARASGADQTTVDRAAAEALRLGARPAEFWSFAAALDGSPRLNEYRPGDHCVLQVSSDPYIPEGSYRRRILELSGDIASDWVEATCGPAYGFDEELPTNSPTERSA